MAAAGHSTWSASATSRNWACPGALALGAKVPEAAESEAAGWGTACHAVSEACLSDGRDAVEWIDRRVATEEHDFVVDEEMAETAQTYIDYVRGRCAAYEAETGQKAELLIERRFSLEKLDPPFDAGGTADAVIYFPLWSLLEVIDLKGGRGVVVEIHENKQTRTYGLGAVLTLPHLKVARVRSTIVQPRAQHKDGVIRFEEFDIVELMEWTSDLVAVMHRSHAAGVAYDNILGDVSRDAWGKEFLAVGEHCGFCPARAICPAQEAAALDAAGVWFTDADEPRLRNTPDELDPTRLARVLDMADMIESWLNACRALAHRLAENGKTVPGYQLVDRIGRRRWIDEDDVFVGLVAAGMTMDDLFERKLKSPAQIEKALGAARKRALEPTLKALIEKPLTGTNLVRSDKTTRPAVTPGPSPLLTAIED